MDIYCNLSIKAPGVGGGGGLFYQAAFEERGVKRDRGLINFDFSKQARECNEGEGGGGA